MTVPERMSLMGPPCAYSVDEHQRIGRVGTRGLTMAPLQWPMGRHPTNKLTEVRWSRFVASTTNTGSSRRDRSATSSE